MVSNKRVQPEEEPDIAEKNKTPDKESKNDITEQRRVKLKSVLSNLENQRRFKNAYEDAIKLLSHELRINPKNNVHSSAKLENARIFLQEVNVNIRAFENEARILTKQLRETSEAEEKKDIDAAAADSKASLQSILFGVKAGNDK